MHKTMCVPGGLRGGMGVRTERRERERGGGRRGKGRRGGQWTEERRGDVAIGRGRLYWGFLHLKVVHLGNTLT